MVVDEIKYNLVNELESHFDSSNPSLIIWVSEGIDDFVSMFLRQTLRKYTNEIITKDGLSICSNSDNVFDLMIAADVWKPEVLEVALFILGIERPTKKPKAVNISIEKFGRYRRARVYVANKTHFHIELIVKIINSCFETAYSWLEEKIRLHIVSEHVRITQKAYGYIRTIISNPQLNQRIWLATVTKNRGFHLLDHSVLDMSLELIKDSKELCGENPLRLITEILTNTLPYEKMLTKIAIEKGDYISVSLNDASYKKEKIIYHKAAVAIHGDEVGIFPFIKEGGIFLVAIFPHKLSDAILPSLRVGKDQISRIYLSSTSNIKRLLMISKSGSIDWPASKFGEVMGGFIKAWVT